MSEHDAAGSRADQPPHTSSVWLPAGTQRTVLIDASTAPFPSSDGTPAVVEVCFDPAGDVVARMDGEILGAFDAEASAALSPSLRLLEARGLVAVAHGAFTTVDGQPALTVHADPLGSPRTRSHPVDVPTDPFPATEPFAADKEAEAAALAADASATTSGGSTVARSKPQSRNLQTVAILGTALIIGAVGVLGFSYGVRENGREMSAFTSFTDGTIASSSVVTSLTPATESSSPSSSPSSEEPTTSTSQDDSRSEDADEPSPAPAPEPAPAPNPAPNHNPAPAPAPAPAPNPNPAPAPEPAPAPAPNPAPAPAPAPAPDGGNGGGGGNAPQPRPIFELQW